MAVKMMVATTEAKLLMIDFNADLAEGCPHDMELMRYVSSANISCAAHAGSPAIMMQTLREAKTLGLRVGAHPGYFDREHFGRKELPITANELYEILLYQLGAIKCSADDVGISVSYVKPHGAMYHQAGREIALAESLVAAANRYQLAVMGLPGSQVELACKAAGVPYMREGFADRRYRADGTLVPRSELGAMLHNPAEAVKQIRWLIDKIGVETICVHGDEPEAVAFVRDIKQLLS